MRSEWVVVASSVREPGKSATESEKAGADTLCIRPGLSYKSQNEGRFTCPESSSASERGWSDPSESP